MHNILSVDVEDWFHILELNSPPPFEHWNQLESRIEKNLNFLLDAFDKYGIRVTCFFLGWVGERYPHLVKLALARGHEIASHGYAHQLIYTQTRSQFREDVKKSKDLLEQITGKAVLGYRAPGFSIIKETPWALEELAACGYRYDSSIFPTSRGHGGLVDAPLDPHVIQTTQGAILEFPISVANFLGKRVCFFGGGYLRFFPYFLIRRMSEAVNRQGRPIVYYIHPREIDVDHPRLPMGRFRKFKCYVNLSTTEKKLKGILKNQRVVSFEKWISQNSSWA